MNITVTARADIQHLKDKCMMPRCATRSAIHIPLHLAVNNSCKPSSNGILQVYVYMCIIFDLCPIQVTCEHWQ